MRKELVQLPTDILKVVKTVKEKTKPVSIFLYGSRAKGDFTPDSDFEMAVLYHKNKQWSRRQLFTMNTFSNLVLYPFVLEELEVYRIETPFPKATHLREIISTAVTIEGKPIIENMASPAITLIDLLEDITFRTAGALAAILSSRQDDWITAKAQFTKSILFGTRVLIILENKTFPLTYREIYEQGINLDISEEDRQVIKQAFAAREGATVNKDTLYDGVGYLNEYIYPKIKRALANGNKIILPGNSIDWK